MLTAFASENVNSQQPAWKLIPRGSNSLNEVVQQSGMDFENFVLLVEIFNAIDLLESNSAANDHSFLSDQERDQIHAIKMELNEPLFLEAYASQRGQSLDLDVIFAMRTGMAKDLLEPTSTILGDKMRTVIQMVNRRRIGDWSGNSPLVLGERMAELLSFTREQGDELQGLAGRFAAQNKSATKELADKLRGMQENYLNRMVRELDDDGRLWYMRAFGSPVNLLNDDGTSVFHDLIARYNLGDSNGLPETVKSDAVKPDRPDQHAHDPTDSASTDGPGPESIKIDMIAYAMMQSKTVHRELALNQREIEQIRKQIGGKRIELTNANRTQRLMELMAGAHVEDSELFDLLNSKQRERLHQIEMQLRTGENINSFGMLHDLVANHLRMQSGQRTAIESLSKEYSVAVAELFRQYGIEYKQRVGNHQLRMYDVLTESQKMGYEEFFGTPVR